MLWAEQPAAGSWGLASRLGCATDPAASSTSLLFSGLSFLTSQVCHTSQTGSQESLEGGEELWVRVLAPRLSPPLPLAEWSWANSFLFLGPTFYVDPRARHRCPAALSWGHGGGGSLQRRPRAARHPVHPGLEVLYLQWLPVCGASGRGRCIRTPQCLPVAIGSTHTSHCVWGRNWGGVVNCMVLEHPPAASCIRFNRTLSSTLGSSSVMDFGSRRGPFRPGVNE